MSTLTPTDEQAAILDGFTDHRPMVIEAAAGSGKTSTLKMLARLPHAGRMVYIAYNRAIKDEAKREFPNNTHCSTAHGLAYGPVATAYKHRLGGRRLPAQQAANALGIREPVRLSDDLAPYAPAQLVRFATATVNRFCYSADPEPDKQHVPYINGLEAPEVRKALIAAVLPIARKVWADIQSTTGELHFTHDHYLKMWQLTGPRIDTDVLLVDEAQDLNPVVAAIVAAQKCQVIMVGDANQSIYQWRGAIDAMSTFPGSRYRLTQSFRFGPAIADQANLWLELIGTDMRVRGTDKVPSVVGPCLAPDAVLCRTNSTAVSQVIAAFDRGERVALVGGGAEIARLAKAALDLKAGKPTDHPELLAFSSWAEVQDYASQDSGGSDLKVMVNLIDDHGADKLLTLADQLCDERYADLTVSTAHKAKGREWDAVRVASDFREPKRNEDGTPGVVPKEQAMLSYVTVTRAKRHLDRGGLAWVDGYVGAAPMQINAHPVPTPAAPAPRRATKAPKRPSVESAPFRMVDGLPAWPTELLTAKRCGRCCSDTCMCDPAVAAAWMRLTGISAGPRFNPQREAVGRGAA